MLFATFIVTRHIIAPIKMHSYRKWNIIYNHKMQSDQIHYFDPIALIILIQSNDISWMIYTENLKFQLNKKISII